MDSKDNNGDGNNKDKFELMNSDDRAAMLSSETSAWLNVAKFEQFQRVASMLAKTDFIPERFRGHVGNCMIALDMAQLMGMHPVMLMRTMYIVHGTPGFEGKFVSALINNSGRYCDPLEYEWKGEKGKSTWGCRAYAVRKSTGKTVYGPWVDWELVQREGWHKPKGSQASKWTTMPEIMFLYRAATFFGRVNDSDLLLGMQTIDEIEDISADLSKRPDGSFAISSTEKPQKVSYEATAKPPEEKKPHLHMPHPETVQVNYEGDAPVQLDEFGTATDSPFEKSKWFHLRAGSIKDGTGFGAYVQQNARQIPDASETTYRAMGEKYQKLYGRPMPYGRDGLTIAQGDQAPADPPPEEAPPESIEPLPDAPPEEDMQPEVMDSAYGKLLKQLETEHKREFVMVTKGQAPADYDQALDWVNQINELVIKHQKTPPGDDQGAEDKF